MSERAARAGRFRADVVWIVALGLSIAILFALLREAHRIVRPEAGVGVDRAEFVASERGTPPPDDAGWEAVDLPHDWLFRHGVVASGWYRASFDFGRVRGRFVGIYLPLVNRRVDLFVNGENVAQPAANRAPFWEWNRPHYALVPGELLRDGSNVLHVRIRTEPPGFGILGPVFVGPDRLLRPHYDRRYFVKVTAPALIIAGMLATALFIGILWIRRPRTTVYLMVPVGAVIWSLYGGNLVVEDPPTSLRAWNLIRFACLGAFTVSALYAVNRFIDERQPRLELGMLVAVTAGFVVLLLLEADVLYRVGFRVWNVVLLALAAYPLARAVRAVWPDRDIGTFLLLVAGGLVIVCGAHDALSVTPLASRADGLLFPYTPPLVVVAFGWILIGEFVEALGEAESLNRELEDRVEEKGAELERNWRRIRGMERERVRSHERERIMRDLHDGFGGQLVSTLASIEAGAMRSDDVARAIHGALDDMRLMIDSLEPVEGDVPSALAMVRSRLGRRIETTGIRIAWKVVDVPPVPALGPEGVLHLVRIVQEAITNVLRHSGARTLTVGTAVEDGRVVVEVRDDGCGFPERRDGAGQGLRNMHRRANAIGARLDVRSGNDGTCIRIVFRSAGPTEADPAAP